MFMAMEIQTQVIAELHCTKKPKFKSIDVLKTGKKTQRW